MEEFRVAYANTIRDTLLSNYVLISKKLDMKGVEEELNESIESTIARKLLKEDNQGGLGNDSDSITIQKYGEIFEFVALTLISGYYNLTNIDFRTSDIASFGFRDCEYFITTMLKSIQGVNFKEIDSKNTAFNSIVSKCRDISVSEYLSNRLYMEDIIHIRQCLTKESIPRYLTKKEEKLLLSRTGGLLAEILVDLKSMYRELIKDAYGLEKYAGVFTLQTKTAVQGLDNTGTVKTVQPNDILSYAFLEPLIENYPVYHSSIGAGNVKFSSRQFNYEIIGQAYNMQGVNSNPVYFPHKMLEILNGFRYTFNIQTQTYQKSEYGNNAESYLEYLCGTKKDYDEDDYDKLPPMGQEVLMAMGYSCNKSLKEDGRDLTVEEVITNVEYRELFTLCIKNMRDFLSYCVKCYTTCFTLISINSRKLKINDFRIRVSYPKYIEFNNKDYVYKVKSKYPDTSMDSELAEDISSYKIETSFYDCYVQDFTYCSNPELAFGMPLFAYKALDKMIEQGRELNWNSILLGKAESGTLITSQSKSNIHLQDTRFHYLIAGSRSGKGVMGYNILGTALASMMPIFYMDRKPDTASVMKGISSTMFAINGGQYEEGLDTKGTFHPERLPYKIPPYLDFFFSGDTQLMGDMAYFRGILFAINLAVFMSKLENSLELRETEVYKKLEPYLNKGMFVVFDEFTQYTDKFLQKYIVPYSQTGKAVFSNLPKLSVYEELTRQGFGSIRKAVVKLEKMKEEYQRAIDEGKRSKINESDLEYQTMELQAEIRQLERSTIDLSKIYWNEFYRKFVSALNEWDTLKDSGAGKGGFINKVHFFIIGQSLNTVLFESEKFDDSNGKLMFNKSMIKPEVIKTSKTEATNMLYSFLKSQASDIIMGYQPADRESVKYLGLNQRKWGTKANNLLTENKRFFCYKDMTKDGVVNTLYRLTEPHKAFGNSEDAKRYINSCHYFKPFLILNTGDIPDEQYLYPNPKDRNDTKVSLELMSAREKKTGSAQYVAQCLTACNNVGITYDDLVRENPDNVDNGRLSRLVGFEDYMEALFSYNGNSQTVADALGLSGEVANIIVKEVLGYEGTFEEYIYDFRAEALFDWKDWINALKGDKSVRTRLKDSFFMDCFVTAGTGNETFASVFKERLGSLYDYYMPKQTEEVIVPKVVEEEVLYYENDGRKLGWVGNNGTTGVGEPDKNTFTKDMAGALVRSYFDNLIKKNNLSQSVDELFTYEELEHWVQVVYSMVME